MKTLLTILFLIPLTCFAQRQGNIWYFGDHAGVDFNSGVPVSISNGQTYNNNILHSEGTAVICDSSGSLLFYTNGQKIWNRNHQVMPAGDSLLGHLSSTQAALIVPQPGSSRFFYVFTTDAFYQDALQYGFRYSIVDICLNNGLGDIGTGKKNILLLDTVAEKLTAVRHSNGTDYWIITHKFYSDAFYAYRLSSAGIVDTVITHIGSVHQEYCSGTTDPTRSAIGWMKASPDGNKIACVNGQTCYSISEMFDFSKTTGVVSNMIQLQTDSLAISLYGVTFSPDNSKLYISCCINHDRIYQYDLSSGNPATIVNSKAIVADHAGGPFFMAMALGPDGKIYICERNQSYLGVINDPDVAGVNCNYVDQAVLLSGACSYGLPNFIDFYNYSNTSYSCLTGVDELTEKDIVNVFPNPVEDKFNVTVEGSCEIAIYDAASRKLMQKRFTNSTSINTQQLARGIYIYKITNESGTIKEGKIVKQ